MNLFYAFCGFAPIFGLLRLCFLQNLSPFGGGCIDFYALYRDLWLKFTCNIPGFLSFEQRLKTVWLQIVTILKVAARCHTGRLWCL
ncbi:hypothetical protein CAMRE0001_1008 [Campylobacter rectus RM3267]|uniref:Uncharacterized protein n=1 Tax=Campylobacter rectus RM3267 TaxID=553218 RepID=B9D2R3_CAMRE|nr:hypothetical protein CAMRE0001_1008 [Campylobacter rectus RM3267]